MIEGSRSLTNGSRFGRPKNKWILRIRIRIRNTTYSGLMWLLDKFPTLYRLQQITKELQLWFTYFTNPVSTKVKIIFEKLKYEYNGKLLPWSSHLSFEANLFDHGTASFTHDLPHPSTFWHLRIGASIPLPFWGYSISLTGRAAQPKNPPSPPHLWGKWGMFGGGGGRVASLIPRTQRVTNTFRIFGYHKNINTALFLPESSASDSPSRIRKMSWWWSSCRDTNYQPKNF